MKILVPFSHDANMQDAIREAVALAGSDGALVLAKIGQIPEQTGEVEDAFRALRADMEDLANRIHEVPVATKIELAHDPVRGILSIAQQEGVDRIVVSPVEGTSLERLVTGDVDDDLKEAHERIPVTVISS